MKIRNPWVLKLIGFAAYWLISLWMGTLRYRLIFCGPEKHPGDPRCKRFIYAFWHEAFLFPTRLRSRIHILISTHADGELIAQTCRHMRAKTIRGSTTRGGTQALLRLMRVSQTSHLLVTPDGPRGPRRRVQTGIIFLASKTGLPIVPCGVGYRRCWRFNSWDRFALPWPWTEAVGVALPAIAIPPQLARNELEYYRELVEQRMLEATAAAEQLAINKGAIPTTLAADRPALRASA